MEIKSENYILLMFQFENEAEKEKFLHLLEWGIQVTKDTSPSVEMSELIRTIEDRFQFPPVNIKPKFKKHHDTVD